MMTALSVLHAGYEVYFVTEASAGGSRESHDSAVRRMIQAGCMPISAGTYLKELQRDWAPDETAAKVRDIYTQQGSVYGQAVKWEGDLIELK